MNKVKKGFTLIEIVVAVALLGVLSVGFLGVISNNFSFLFESKQITEDAFLTQMNMELAIETLKQDITSGTVALTTVNLFENVPVSYASLSDEYSGRKFYTYVSNTRLPQIEKLKISNVGIRLNYNAVQTTYAYDFAPTNLEAFYTNDPATAGDLMVNLFSWYVSKPGFNMPVPRGSNLTFNYLSDVPESEILDRYPVFPRDYELIASLTSNKMLDLSTYSGRHIMLTVTPAAKSGRIGETGVAIPLHINGLEITSNLLVHLDASYIDPYDTTEVLSSTNRRVIRWYDIASNIGVTAPTEFATNTNATNRPELIDTDPLNSFISRFVRFTTTRSVTIQNQNTSGSVLNYFAVARGRNASVEETLFTNGTHTAKLIETPDNMISSDGWYLIKGSYTSDSNSFVFGNSDVDIIEFIVFNSAVDDNQISEYIKKKYVPLDSDAEIISLYDDAKTVYVGESYILPDSVLADMSVGADRLVEVNWNGTVDTSVAGTLYLTATAKADSSKTMTLTINIIPKPLVDSIELSPSSLNMIVGTNATVSTVVLPESAFDKTLLWTSSNNSIASVVKGVVTAVSPGTATITVSSNDGNATSTLPVTVSLEAQNYYWPSDMVLQLDASLSYDSSDNSSVASWNDRSSSGNNFSQGTSSKRPTWNQSGLNNLYTVTFDGSDDNMVHPNTTLSSENLFSNGSNTFSVFVVGKSTSTSVQRTFFGKAGGWGGSATYNIGTDKGDFALKLRGKTIDVDGNTGFNYHSSVWNGTQNLYYVNGLILDTSTSGSASIQSYNISIGATNNGASDYLAGDLAEVIVFSRNLDDNERKYVENYLKLKWFTTPTKAWDFTSGSSAGWSVESNISSFVQTSTGFVNGTINGPDPHIISTDNLNVNITDQKTLLIRLKNSTTSDTAQIYFTTTSDTGFDELKHVDFKILPNSDYTDYVVYMGAIPSWTGSLKQLRLDPAVNANGNFSLDFIRILE